VNATTTTLGSTAVPVLRLAFGCEQLGGHNWGNVLVSEVASAVDEAIDRGVNLFDTADCYGLGDSERRLGELVRARRDKIMVATKFGVRVDAGGRVSYDSSPQWAERALDASLERLRTDCVDLFQLHHWDGHTPIVDTLARMERLRSAGKCRYVGATNVRSADLPATLPEGFVSLSLEYSLVAREADLDVRAAAGRGLSFLCYGILAQGLLSGRYGPQHRFGADDRRSRATYVQHHGARRERNSGIIAVLSAAAAALDASPVQVAIAWVLQRLPRAIALVGIKRPAQLRDALGALEINLTHPWRSRLDDVSALPAQCGPEHAGT
jgi:aryl-alcohol dehydrogenase-like predicted oxidoreductase